MGSRCRGPILRRVRERSASVLSPRGARWPRWMMGAATGQHLGGPDPPSILRSRALHVSLPPRSARPAGGEGLASDPRTPTLGGGGKKKRGEKRLGEKLAGWLLRSEIDPPIERPYGGRCRSGFCGEGGAESHRGKPRRGRGGGGTDRQRGKPVGGGPGLVANQRARTARIAVGDALPSRVPRRGHPRRVSRHCSGTVAQQHCCATVICCCATVTVGNCLLPHSDLLLGPILHGVHVV